MTKLEVRRPPFEFEDDVPFLWNETSPAFSAQMNAVSFVAIAFEKYIVRTIRDALPRIDDAEVAEEAQAFLRQEAQHSAAHSRHVAALCRRYPGLSSVLDDVIASYDALFAARPLDYHLAYIATLEATFTPAFDFLIEQEARLFAPGDDRVASLFLWHFVEEIEHRSSALRVYRHVIDSEWRRLAVVPSLAAHLFRVFRVTAEGFDRHVPFSDRRIEARALLPSWRPSGGEDPFAGIPLREKLRARWGLLRAVLPSHDPARATAPRFAAQWLERYARGEDVTRWYASSRERASM